MTKSKILLPLLSKRESSADFLNNALSEVEEVVLLLVIDKEAMIGQFGFAAGEIMQGTQLLENLHSEIWKRKIKCEDILEWGNTEQKIVQLAQLKNVGKIVLAKQNNKYFQDLEKKLKQSKIEIQLIELPSETKEEIQKTKIDETKIEQKTVVETATEKTFEKKELEKQNIEARKPVEKKETEAKKLKKIEFVKAEPKFFNPLDFFKNFGKKKENEKKKSGLKIKFV